MSTKGKAKELDIGWWQLLPLAERDHRPVVWSGLSTIFAAHRRKPCVTGRHFPSLTAFEVPSPPLVDQSPSSYEPPIVISLSPDNNWLFAYFPGQDVDGIGCLWSRNVELDAWTVKKSRSFARSAGVVAASWASSYRQWVTSPSGFPSRLPPRGPPLPLAAPILILTTQTQYVEVWYLPVGQSLFGVLRASLAQPSATAENIPHSASFHDLSNAPGGTKLCVSAAIGVGYSESSVLIAMRTYLHPPPSKDISHNAMDLGFPLNMPSHLDTVSSEASSSKDWELWGEEPSIELCEVQIHFDGVLMSLITKPMPPIRHPEACLSRLTFIPRFSKDFRTRNGANHVFQPFFNLAASFISFGDYSSVPQTTLALYSINRSGAAPNAPWSVRLTASRTFTETPLAFVAPVPGTSNLLAGILSVADSLPRKNIQVKEIPVGRLVMLDLNDLSEDDSWESSAMLASIHAAGIDLPLNGTISPNHALVCCTSPSADMSSPISVQSAPRRREAGNLPQLSHALISAIHSRAPPVDVIQILARPSSSLETVSDILLEVLCVLENPALGLRGIWVRELVGVAVELYRTKARQAGGELLKELNGRWQTGHDLCTISAYNGAFEECREDDAYDLEAVWQLVGLSNWTVEFLERLMKECVLFAEQQAENGDIKIADDLFGSVPYTQPIPHILLHVIHPYCLTTLHGLIRHVKHFRGYLGSLSATTESVQTAKDVLVDLVDCSGIDLLKLEPLLATFGHDMKSPDVTALQQSLVCCRPMSTLRPALRTLANKLNSPQVVDKPRLFIKPSDLIDGVSKVSLTSNVQITGVGKERDVVSTGILSSHGTRLVCSRCGGTTEKKADASTANVGSHISRRWNIWERVWSFRCICGGLWQNAQTS